MIYLDTSVLLAHLLAEDKSPPERLWKEILVSSRLLEYEVWNRVHALDLAESHGDAVRQALASIALLELVSPVVIRTIEPFPIRLRTLDALHIATIVFLQTQGQDVKLASYDDRMLKAARKLHIPIYKL